MLYSDELLATNIVPRKLFINWPTAFKKKKKTFHDKSLQLVLGRAALWKEGDGGENAGAPGPL